MLALLALLGVFAGVPPEVDLVPAQRVIWVAPDTLAGAGFTHPECDHAGGRWLRSAHVDLAICWDLDH